MEGHNQKLKNIKNRMAYLHNLKAQCRKDAGWVEEMNFFVLGKQHCQKCEQWTQEQKMLRRRKRQIMIELEILKKKNEWKGHQ